MRWIPTAWRAPLLLFVAALLASRFPDAFLLTRSGLAEGEVWRVFTGHLVHRTSAHFVFDVGVALLLLSHLRQLWMCVVLAPTVGLGTFLLRPDIQSYAGLSGVLHGVFVLVCIDMIRQRVGLVRGISMLLLGGVLLKATLECATHVSITQSYDMGGVTLFEAHGIGLLCGLILSLWRRPTGVGWRTIARC